MSTTFKAGQITDQSAKIFDDMIEVFEKRNLNELISELKEGIASSEQSEKIKVAFVGQFSSGKSSIISALTGNKAIKIGSDVTTDSCENYEWGNFFLTDTPGLQNNEKHDDIAETAIKNSDLIIYCITSELFNKNILADFKNLAFEKSYKDKMVLLVNKINSEFTENIDDLLNTYESDLKKAIQPYHLDDVPHCFIDVKDYLDGEEYEDVELINESRFINFIELLNNILSEKGLLYKLTTPILLAKQIIEEAFVDTSETTEEKTKRTALSRLTKLIDRHRTKASKDWDHIISSEIFLFQHQGYELANRLGEQDVDLELEITEIFNNTSKQLSDNLQKFAFDCASELHDELDEIFQSKVGQYLLAEIGEKTIHINELDDTKRSKEGINQALNQADRLVNDMIQKVKPEQLYKIVEKIGHDVFKIKFKPWGITKTAGKLAKALKALGPAMEIVNLAMDCKATLDEDKEAAKLNQARKDLRKYINEIATDLRSEFDKQKKPFLTELYEPVSNEIETINQTMNTLSTESKDFNEKLEQMKRKLNELLESIVK